MLHLQKKKIIPQKCADTKNKLRKMQVDRRGAEIFMLNTPRKTREKVKINGKYFHIQVDTGSDIILIPFIPY